MDPLSTTSGSIVIGKIIAALAGLLGGISVSFFYQPQKLVEHGKLAAGAIVGGISVGASFALAGIIAIQLGLDIANTDIALGIGYLVGLVSVGIISWVANFLEKREHKDILEITDEITAVATRVSAKKAPLP